VRTLSGGGADISGLGADSVGAWCGHYRPRCGLFRGAVRTLSARCGLSRRSVRTLSAQVRTLSGRGADNLSQNADSLGAVRTFPSIRNSSGARDNRPRALRDRGARCAVGAAGSCVGSCGEMRWSCGEMRGSCGGLRGIAGDCGGLRGIGRGTGIFCRLPCALHTRMC
jgi:hypothetical protein